MSAVSYGKVRMRLVARALEPVRQDRWKDLLRGCYRAPSSISRYASAALPPIVLLHGFSVEQRCDGGHESVIVVKNLSNEAVAFSMVYDSSGVVWHRPEFVVGIEGA